MNPPAGHRAGGGHDENGVAPDRGAAVFFSPLRLTPQRPPRRSASKESPLMLAFVMLSVVAAVMAMFDRAEL